jgi:hypothetical protein
VTVSDDDTLMTWREWLQQIGEDVTQLYEFRRIFKDSREIVSKNPAVQAPSLYHDFVASCYVAYAVMAVRRQVRRRRDSVSLVKLLKEIEDHPDVMSRTRFTDMYPVGLPRDILATADYDRFADRNGNQVSPEVVRQDRLKLGDHEKSEPQQDRDRLESAVKRVIMLADKRVAHLDYTKPIDPVPTYADLDEAIDTLGSVFNKYNVLLTGTSLLTMEPTIAVDWTAIFQVPWLPNVSAEPDNGSPSS